MPAPTPAKRTSEIFNRLNGIGIEDIDAAERCLFQLRALGGMNKLDFSGRVAWAQAALIAGYRDQALEQMHAAYYIRDMTDWPAFDALMRVHMHAGLWGRALELSRALANTPGMSANELVMTNCALVALGAGDVAFLQELAKIQQSSKNFAGGFLKQLEELEMLEHFGAHQRIVNEIVKDVQIHRSIGFCPDDDGCMVIIDQIYVDGTRTTRQSIRDRLYDALEADFAPLVPERFDYDLRVMPLVSVAPRHSGVSGVAA
ncbi:hypothetical protein WCLP8_3470009 [uncultured Gammaproteobacteria bacterium]